MGFRFRRSIKLLPGVKINLSTTGASVSLGGKGGTLNVGKRGVRTTYDLPGSGAYYSKDTSWKSVGDLLGSKPDTDRTPSNQAARPSRSTAGSAPKRSTKSSISSLTPKVGQAEIADHSAPIYIAPGARLDLNYFQKLSVPDDEEALLSGLKALLAGDQQTAFQQFSLAAAASADGAFMAGVCALQFGIHTDAMKFLQRAIERQAELGGTLKKYGVSAWVSFQLTDEVVAHVQPNHAGALLALAEAQQQLGDNAAAQASLRVLLAAAPGDMLTRVALAELLADEESEDAEVAQELAELGAGIENDSELHCILLLYQARALQRLGLLDGAKAALTRALSKRKDRGIELLCVIRYERALVYEALGDNKAARADLERIYADDPDFEDVATKLGK